MIPATVAIQDYFGAVTLGIAQARFSEQITFTRYFIAVLKIRHWDAIYGD
jgi:hypothetical protein